jgi:hypothetical protein
MFLILDHLVSQKYPSIAIISQSPRHTPSRHDSTSMTKLQVDPSISFVWACSCPCPLLSFIKYHLWNKNKEAVMLYLVYSEKKITFSIPSHLHPMEILYATTRPSSSTGESRVAMLATIGMVVPGIKGESLMVLQVLESLKPSQYFEMLGTCAFLEAFVFVQQDAKDM